MTTLPDDLVKVRLSECKRWLIACMPDGTEIPCQSKLVVTSGANDDNYAHATLELLVDITQIDKLTPNK